MMPAHSWIVDPNQSLSQFKAALLLQEPNQIVETAKKSSISRWNYPSLLLEKARAKALTAQFLRQEIELLYPKKLPPKVIDSVISLVFKKVNASSPFSSLQVSQLQQALAEIKKTIHCPPTSLSLFPPELFNETPVALFIRYLFTESTQLPSFTDKKYLRAIFYRQDDALLSEMREEMQCLFDRLNEMAAHLTADQEKIFAVFLGHALSIYTYSSPPQGQKVSLPQKIDGKWQKVQYEVDLIALTPASISHPYFAHGLLPIDKKSGAHPILLFMGTTYPAAKGSLLTYIADFTPGLSVGEGLLLIGKKKLSAWLEKANSQTNQLTDAYGVSLGGSLALLTEAYWPEKIGAVKSYSPPALMRHSVRGYQQKLVQLGKKPQVEIYCQHNDWIPSVGTHWAKGWKLYKVITPNNHRPFKAHNKVFSGQKDVGIIKLSRKRENGKISRAFISAIHHLVAIPIFTLAFLYLAASYLLKKGREIVWKIDAKKGYRWLHHLFAAKTNGADK